jgi:hypothetical protein
MSRTIVSLEVSTVHTQTELFYEHVLECDRKIYILAQKIFFRRRISGINTKRRSVRL